MKSIIEQLFDADIRPYNAPIQRTSEEQEVLEQLDSESKELRSMIGREAWQKYLEVEALTNMLNTPSTMRIFVRGFKLGATIIMETLA